MQSAWLEKRVEILENAMNGPGGVIDRVDRLEGKVDHLQSDFGAFRTEFSQFVVETRGEFSAIRREIRHIRQELTDGLHDTQTQMRVLHEDLVERIKGLARG